MYFLNLDRKIRLGNCDGFALLTTLGVMSILAVLAWSFSFMVRTEMKISSFSNASGKNYYAARAGLHRAAGIIRSHWKEPANGPASPWWSDKKLYKKISYNGTHYSIFKQTYFESSGFNATVNTDSNSGSGGEIKLEYGVDDEESRLNINIATPEMLMQFDGVTSVLAEEILIFRVKKQNQAASAKSRDKESLITGPILELDELLQIKGMTRKILYGTPKKLDSLADNLTCFSSGKINVNTARPMVFKALGFSDREVNTILQYRNMDGETLPGVSEFFGQLGLDKNKHKKIHPVLTVKSKNFRLACMAWAPDRKLESTILSGLSVADDTMRFRLWKIVPQGGVQ
jgi:general secretion pathway protein K